MRSDENTNELIKYILLALPSPCLLVVLCPAEQKAALGKHWRRNAALKIGKQEQI